MNLPLCQISEAMRGVLTFFVLPLFENIFVLLLLANRLPESTARLAATRVTKCAGVVRV